MIIARAKDTLNRARNIDLSSGVAQLKDQIGGRNSSDLIRFNLSQRSSVNLSLNELKANANLRLLNNNKSVLYTSAQQGRNSEAIGTTVDAGTYFIQVYTGSNRRNSSSTSYSLKVASSLVSPLSNTDDDVTRFNAENSINELAHSTVNYTSKPSVSNTLNANYDDGSVVDLMVAYTAEARDAQGGTNAINTVIRNAVHQINQGYANSGVIHRLRLVHTHEVGYVESGVADTDLTRLQNSSDGYMDDVHALRNTYGADIVSLFVNTADSAGISYVMSNVSHEFESLAFNVVQTNAAKDRYTLAHEIGHVLGAEHDRAHADAAVAYSYAYGYINANGTGDVMSYAKDRRNYYSSPDVIVDGKPLGSAQEDVVKAFNAVSSTAANWRKSVLQYSRAPKIAIGAVDADASEKNAEQISDFGKFTLTRTGSTESALTVSYQLSGTAAQGVDYSALDGSITFAAGSSKATIAIHALNDSVVENSETVVVTLLAGANYELDAAYHATVAIADNDATYSPASSPINSLFL